MMNEAFLRRRASDEFESAAAALLGDAERGIIIVDWFARSRPMFRLPRNTWQAGLRECSGRKLVYACVY